MTAAGSLRRFTKALAWLVTERFFSGANLVAASIAASAAHDGEWLAAVIAVLVGALLASALESYANPGRAQ